VELVWMGGWRFAGQTEDGRSIAIAGAEDGAGAAPTPVQMLLAAVAGCTGIDTVSILEKKRRTIERFSVVVTGERRPTHPRALARVSLEYRLTSPDALPEDLRRAVELSQERYCSVLASLSGEIEVETRLIHNGSPLPSPGT
jgi:putative redox protein